MGKRQGPSCGGRDHHAPQRGSKRPGWREGVPAGCGDRHRARGGGWQGFLGGRRKGGSHRGQRESEGVGKAAEDPHPSSLCAGVMSPREGDPARRRPDSAPGAAAPRSPASELRPLRGRPLPRRLRATRHRPPLPTSRNSGDGRGRRFPRRVLGWEAESVSAGAGGGQ